MQLQYDSDPNFEVQFTMWLLSTARADIQEFGDPQDMPPYAIISHIIDDQHLESLEQLVRS